MTTILALDLIWNMCGDKLGELRFFVMCITCVYTSVFFLYINCVFLIASDGLNTRSMKYSNEELVIAGI